MATSVGELPVYAIRSGKTIGRDALARALADQLGAQIVGPDHTRGPLEAPHLARPDLARRRHRA